METLISNAKAEFPNFGIFLLFFTNLGNFSVELPIHAHQGTETPLTTNGWDGGDTTSESPSFSWVAR